LESTGEDLFDKITPVKIRIPIQISELRIWLKEEQLSTDPENCQQLK
jgi:hypothetical protein